MCERTKVDQARYSSNRQEKKYREEEAGWESLSRALGIVDDGATGQLEASEAKTQVELLIPKLSDGQRFVIQCLYFDDLTLEETASLQSVTPERIRQIKSAALEKLRGVVNLKELSSRIKIAMNSQNG